MDFFPGISSYVHSVVWVSRATQPRIDRAENCISGEKLRACGQRGAPTRHNPSGIRTRIPWTIPLTITRINTFITILLLQFHWSFKQRNKISSLFLRGQNEYIYIIYIYSGLSFVDMVLYVLCVPAPTFLPLRHPVGGGLGTEIVQLFSFH